MTNFGPNKRGGGDGGIAVLFYAVRARPAAPQHERGVKRCPRNVRACIGGR